MAVAALANDYAALNGAAKATAKSATEEMSDRFLKLLVTQLKNQDPMNPMENAELTMQLAQMSTVEGINKMNSTLDGLAAQFRAGQALQGAALLGRQVMVEGDALALTAAGAAGGIDLANAADSVRVRVMDENGALLRELDLGGMRAGFNHFVWDGLDAAGVAAPQGYYSFQASASLAGERVAATPYALGGVLSVGLHGAGVEVEVSGLGMRALDQVRQIF